LTVKLTHTAAGNAASGSYPNMPRGVMG
jgi:hypothetical protein